jgi:3-hydroxybutyryl-CoA dehydrogenase
VVDDAPGLVVARIVSQIVNVAADAALFGVAHPDDIDVAMRLGTNYPGGPFSSCDAGGSARWLGVTESLRWFYGEDRYRVSRLLRRSVYEGVAMRDLVRT